MRVAGVSIEDSLLRISISEKKIGFIKPLASEEIKLPKSEEEKILIIKETLHALREKYSLENIVLGIDINNFSYNIIEIPSLSKSDIRNALLFELEKYLPLPPEEYIYDFVVIDKDKDLRKSKVSVLSLRKEKINSIPNIIKESGLNIAAVKCSFIEALNEFIRAGKEKNAVFVYGTEDMYNIAGLKGNSPVSFKTVSKKKDVKAEIEQVAETVGGAIYLGGAYENDLTERINAQTFPLSISHSLAVSVLRTPPIDLDFTPSEWIPVKKDYYPYAISALAGAAVVLFFFNALYSYYKDSATLSTVEKRIEEIKGKASGLLETRKRIESVYEKRRFLHDFKSGKNLTIHVLTELSRTLPKDTWLVSMSVDEKGKVEIEGLSKRASNIIEPLTKSNFFTKVEFISPIVSQDGQERFAIRMEISG